MKENQRAVRLVVSKCGAGCRGKGCVVGKDVHQRVVRLIGGCGAQRRGWKGKPTNESYDSLVGVVLGVVLGKPPMSCKDLLVVVQVALSGKKENQRVVRLVGDGATWWWSTSRPSLLPVL